MAAHSCGDSCRRHAASLRHSQRKDVIVRRIMFAIVLTGIVTAHAQEPANVVFMSAREIPGALQRTRPNAPASPLHE